MPNQPQHPARSFLTALLSGIFLWTGALALAPAPAQAFCGFYVGGAGAKLFNNATMVVMMREGKRTVLSMQNNYQGPPRDFAMVVPVPVVLQKDHVKTLPRPVFDKVDQMASPRLVEYWEQDPCYDNRRRYKKKSGKAMGKPMARMSKAEDRSRPKVKIEAQFEVGEYEIVILSATEAQALERWLRDNKYSIPDGAEAVLRPYIEGGMYFFVARVNVKKVRFEGDQAMLSPLRFHYDTDTFNLPVRLGLLNARGDQDLIVHILARNQRYEAANYKNVTIPSNIHVKDGVRKYFGEFYAALFDQTLRRNPGSVVTEYAWNASTCDPCPGPNLNSGDFSTLGADVLPGQPRGGFVLTRLHARYNKRNLGEDLVFKAAAPIVGGREHLIGRALERGAQPGQRNNFQGRYIIRHPWTGPIACQNPRRGVWGGPPGRYRKRRPQPMAARNTAFAPRGRLGLPGVVVENIPELGVKARQPRWFRLGH